MRSGRGGPAALAASVNAELLDAPCMASLDAHGGLGMYAKRAIAKGERILMEQPLAITPTPEARPFACAVCFADSRFSTSARGDRLKDSSDQMTWARCCSACQVVRWCSDACEKASAKRHRGSCECEALSVLARQATSEIDDPEIAKLLPQACRMLADRHAGISVRALRGRAVSFEDLVRRQMSLCGGVMSGSGGCDGSGTSGGTSGGGGTCGGSGTHGGGDDRALRAVAHAVLAAVPEAARIPIEDLVDVLWRHQSNSFAVLSRGGHELAQASFAFAMHLFNHSCAPNVAFDCVPTYTLSRGSGTLLFALVSLRPIDAGDEICLSYTSTADDGNERRKTLWAEYGFDCRCERCCGEVHASSPHADDQIAASFAAMRCALLDCGTGYASGGKCLHCGRQQPDQPARVTPRAAAPWS
jgi:hypothetical protein